MNFWENSQKIDAQLVKICDKSEAVHRQFYFDAAENSNKHVMLADPIGDEKHSPVRGLIHRYKDRALLLVSMNCPSQCRFCFRKHLVGQQAELSDQEYEKIFDYLKNHSEIEEIIMSGGEPLALSHAKLQKLLDFFSSLPNIRNIRIHTRLPLTSPGQAAIFFDKRWRSAIPVYFVIHCNHYDEITDQWRKFVLAARDNGIVVLSQTVLLKGVNADPNILIKLFSEFLKLGVIPYYLHHPDQVSGTDHFRVTLKEGRVIYRELRGRVSGIGIPHYILDIPGGFGKVEVDSVMIEELMLRKWKITLSDGSTIIYEE